MNKKHCLNNHGNIGTSESAKYPKLSRRHEDFTHMLINEVHVRLIHAGAFSTNKGRILDPSR